MIDLAGYRIIVTRPRSQAQSIAARIQAAGGHAILCPLIEISITLDDTAAHRIRAVGSFDGWIATSANGVRGLVAACRSLGVSLETLPTGYAVGEATLKAANELGVQMVWLPGVHDAESLGQSLVTRFRSRSQRLLAVEGTMSRTRLRDLLGEHGHHVEQALVYRTEPRAVVVRDWQEWLEADGTGVLFYSPSAADSLAQSCRASLDVPRRKAFVVCVGRTTADWFTNQGIPVDGIAKHPSDDGVFEAIGQAISGG